MQNDVEMNEVNSPLLDNNQAKENNDIMIPEVEIKDSKSTKELNLKPEFTGLSKEELEKFANDPFWKKLRLILFILFWLLWAAMLVSAILIVVLSPKCPNRPKQDFWEKKAGYWLDTAAFVDSNNDKVGDFDGLISRLDYIQKQIGAGYIVLDPVFMGQYSKNMFGSVSSFRELDSSVGNLKSFQKLIKETRKRGLEIVLTADFNALHDTSSFLSNNLNASMKFVDAMASWVARDGGSPKKRFKEQFFYSSAPITSSLIDLDLRSESALKEIKESVKMWLDMGVRGFLLTNIAFYVENFTDTVMTMPINLTDNALKDTWYDKSIYYKQIFSIDTLNFLREIRMVMNEVAKKTDKSRLLIVEAGNVGFGLTQSPNPDDMLQYLDGPDKVADMIVSREFLRNRGWNVDVSKYSTSSISNYVAMIPKLKRSRVALTSATSSSLRTTDLLKISAPFLLPGNPILYFGTEIGALCDRSSIVSLNTTVFPGQRSFALGDKANEMPTKCNHMVMPWDNSGYGFNNISTDTDPYIKSSTQTVQGLTAIGRGESILQLHQKLIKVREEPSLQWGDIEMFPINNIKNGTYEIFIRKAEGFPSIIVAIVKDNVDGKVFSFSKVCAKVLPILVYPSNSNLPENKEVSAENIFLKVNFNESLHVFKCVM